MVLELAPVLVEAVQLCWQMTVCKRCRPDARSSAWLPPRGRPRGIGSYGVPEGVTLHALGSANARALANVRVPQPVQIVHPY